MDQFHPVLRQTVDAKDRAHHNALGIDKRKEAVPGLASFQTNLRTAPYGQQTTTVYLALSNPGELSVDFCSDTPRDPQVSPDDVPYWHIEVLFNHRLANAGRTPGGPQNKRLVHPQNAEQKMLMSEHHYDWVEDHEILEVQSLFSVFVQSTARSSTLYRRIILNSSYSLEFFYARVPFAAGLGEAAPVSVAAVAVATALSGSSFVRKTTGKEVSRSSATFSKSKTYSYVTPTASVSLAN